jgi:hypothetical protein
MENILMPTRISKWRMHGIILLICTMAFGSGVHTSIALKRRFNSISCSSRFLSLDWGWGIIDGLDIGPTLVKVGNIWQIDCLGL